MTKKILMKVYDEDSVRDDLIGSIQFDIDYMLKNLNGEFFWKNIYGAPLGVSGEVTRQMNNDPDVASTWKGRILIRVGAEQTERPKLGSCRIYDGEADLAFGHTIENEFEVLVEFG